MRSASMNFEAVCRSPRLRGRLPVAAQLEAHDPAEALHLPPRHVMVGMALESGVVCPLDGPVLLEMARERERRFVLARDPDGERLQTPEDQVCPVGVEDAPEDPLEIAHRVEEGGTADERSGHHVVVARQVLRRGVQDDVRAQVERLLVDGRRERGVDHDDRLLRVAELRDPWNVDHTEVGVRRRLGEEEAHVPLGEATLQPVQVRGLEDRDRDPHLRKHGGDELTRPPVAVPPPEPAQAEAS
jgi:hypothetical protein